MTVRCPRCASRAWISGHACSDCWPGAQDLSASWAAVDYAYPWSDWISRFKFRQELAWAPVFAQAMLQAQHEARPWIQVDWMVPMPIAPSRLQDRGYDQAWVLSQALSEALPAAQRPPVIAQGLVRLSDGEHQHDLSRANRLNNPHLTCVTHPNHAHRWLDAHVLLIDDVCTTGASLQAAAQALRQAGAARVSAWVLARTPPKTKPLPL